MNLIENLIYSVAIIFLIVTFAPILFILLIALIGLFPSRDLH